MFGGPLFEIVSVLFFVFLAMSALVSFLSDVLLKAFQWKSQSLRRGIRHMLEDDGHYGLEIARRFDRHPMITSISGTRTGITSVEVETFTQALATAILPKGVTADPIDHISHSVAALKEGSLKQRLTLVLPPPGASRDQIKEAVKIWCDTSTHKIAERYKADAVAISYIVAALATVLLNVSPIEIGRRLTADDALRSTFASVVPELTTTLFSQGEGLKLVTPDALDEGAAPGADGAPPAALGIAQTGAADAMKKLDTLEVQTMWALYECAKGKIDLPIGWPWMAEAMDKIQSDFSGSAFASLPSKQRSCEAAARSSSTGAVATRLANLKDQGVDPNKKPLYGPNFATENPAIILLGWLIMVVAAAQGAPFWFNALKMVIRR